MNPIKRANILALSWAIEALNKDTTDDKVPEGIDFAVGGQAVVEGVMMRSPNHITIAVRKADGKIKVRKKSYKTLTQKYHWLNQPILRGVINLFEMMIIGTDAINFSANEQLEDAEAEQKPKTDAGQAAKNETSAKNTQSEKASQKIPTTSNQPTEKSKLAKALEIAMFALSFVFAMALSIFLFKFIPLWITTFLEKQFTYISNNYIIFNLIDGSIKMSMFLSYIFILSLIPSFHRIFEYHGAEHKSIFNYESKKPLTVENAAEQIRFHPRCGTSFILIVFVVSIIVYTFIPKQPEFWTNLAIRLAVLPLIAGISYEYLKLSAKYSSNLIVKALIAPGLWFQRLTTKEPDARQLNVALTSLKEALEMEKALR